jgi:pyrimidine operon attenuation protein / uracil phosphoribosyltransferase
MRTVVLDHAHVQRKMQRIAHQLHEVFHEHEELVLVGVAPRGAKVAERLATLLKEIATFKVRLLELRMRKDHPLEAPQLVPNEAASLRGQQVVLVDDVLQSGRTLMHAASHLAKERMERLMVVVLVDRRHRTWPVRADIVGLTLSTTMQEHISVELGEEDAVYLD